VVSPTVRKVLYIEEFDVNATLHSTQEVDLVDGALEIIPDQTGIAATSNWNRIYSIYAPEGDLSVKITLEGAAGEQSSTSKLAGQGGVSVWSMTLTQQQEYVVNLGAAIWPSGGAAFSGVGGEGGGGSFFYKGGELLVGCGGGGGSGDNGIGRAGYGGGIGPTLDLPPIGLFPGSQSTANTTEGEGGRVGGCTIGDYWQTQGIAPCASIGSTTFFTGKDGQKTSNGFGVAVTRGYKAGLNYQYNGGNGTFTGEGGGGGGAGGGDSGQFATGATAGGGDGGLGFAAISIDSATLRGNTRKVGYIKIEAL